MQINGLGLMGYRSFGNAIQRMESFEKINLFIGQNNSGKSNVLLFITNNYSSIIEAIKDNRKQINLNDIDLPQINKTTGLTISIPLSKEYNPYKSLFQKIGPGDRPKAILDKLLYSSYFLEDNGNPWLTMTASFGGTLEYPRTVINDLIDESGLAQDDWSTLWKKITGQNGGGLKSHWIPETLAWIRKNIDIESPNISLIPAIRKVDYGESGDEEDFSGVGIINRLAQIQNPDYDAQNLKNRFEGINKFLQYVTGNKSATIEIPFARDKIIVFMDGKTLPLSSLGTGIHEVIILASSATVLENQVVCIEEPELHLHPSLQKKLLEYLLESTNNQYFISTHSAHLLDTKGIAIFHVQLNDGNSIVTNVLSDAHKFDVCSDLGYRASDLLQSNSIIWVEGPSERIYINHWLKQKAPHLVEGLHYSIMFYGGRLLAHLSAADPEIDEFISLRRLNRNIAIVIDSDKDTPRKHINKTKKRVQEEFNSGKGFAWITKGREIENYILPEILNTALKKVHPSALGLLKTGTYDNCLNIYKTRKGESDSAADKVKVAKEAINIDENNFEVLDLDDRIRQLVKFINEVNGIKSS